MANNKNYSIKDVEEVIQGIDGEIKKVDVTRLTAPGENYLSLVCRVDFEIEKNGETKTIHAVAKRLPMVELEKRHDFTSVAMRNEIRFYSEILPQIKEFGIEYDIDTSYYPEYLGARLSLDPTKTEADEESVLLLKNLIPEGYRNEDRYVGFDLTASKALLRVLATFHATPLAMKFKKPEVFQNLKDFLDSCRPGKPPSPPPGKDDSPDGPGRRKGPEGLLFEKMLDIPACQPYRAKIEPLKDRPHGPETWHSVGLEPWSTVVHNDYWVNNVMVKPREGDEPLVKMVDFQICTYASYAKDLVFFLLSSVRNDIQKKHFDELIRYYYDQLTSILKRVDIPELELSYEDYLEEVKREALKSETCHALFFSTVIFGAKGTGPDVLTGEVDMLDHLGFMLNNISDKQKEKLGIMTELAAERGWL